MQRVKIHIIVIHAGNCLIHKKCIYKSKIEARLRASLRHLENTVPYTLNLVCYYGTNIGLKTH